MSDAIAALRAQLQQLQALRAQGVLDDAAYAAAAAPLERQLIDAVVAAPGTAAAAAAAATPAATAAAAPATAHAAQAAGRERPSRGLVLGLCSAVVAVAVAGYAYTGSPGLTMVDPKAMTAAAQAVAGGEGGDDAQRMADAVEQLAQRLKDQPDNVEGWGMLARSYARLGRHDQAAPAYEQALKGDPQDANLLTDMADTLAVLNNRNLDGRPTQLLEAALKLAPDNPKTLALLGSAAYGRKDYAVAVMLWERLQAVLPPDSGLMPQLQSSIAEVRSLAGMPAAALRADAGVVPAPAAASSPAAAGDSAGVKLSGTVRLSPTLAAQAGPEDTLFIFARPADGSRMPVAILRKQVKDLPLDFSLDDSLAMAPAARLSLFPQVVVSARISKSGQATPAAGDLAGQSAAVANSSRGLVIEINEVLKP